MADFYCMPGLDDLHRLLPRESLADIGVADAIDDPTAHCSHPAVNMEELAVHLAGVLGLASGRYQRQLPPLTRATPAQGCGPMNEAGANRGNGGTAYCATAFGKKGASFDFEAMQRVRWFVPAAHHNAYHPLPPRRHGNPGTGVFLPRADAYQTRAFRQARLPRKEAPNRTTMLKLRTQ
uniref:Uncharacterized protein n=1 Tax=Aegilops tauschii TaxID=37682 RepID=M8CHL4_AEGTA